MGVYIGSYIYIVSYIFKRQYGQLEWNNNLISLTLTDKHGISSGKKIFETTPDKVSEIKVYFARLSFKVDGQKYIFDFEQYHGQWMQRSSQIVTKRVQIDIGLQWWIDKFKSLNIKVSQKITTKRLFGAIGIIVLIFFFL